MKLRAFFACCGGILLILATASTALAQAPGVPFGIGDAVRQSEEARRAPLPRSVATPVLPRLVEPPFTLKSNETLLVRTFRVEGDTLVSEPELRETLTPYEGRKLKLAEIYEAADKITTMYRERGYLVAKAYVPAQDARSGVLRIKVIAGKYGVRTLKNESLVRDSFVQGIMDHALATSPYISKDALERAMLLMYDLPGGGMPRVAIGRGQQLETSDFAFNVAAARSVDGYLLGDNYGSPYTGRNRLSGGINLNSPLGVGDRLSAFGIVSDNANLKNGRIAYSAPIGYSGLRAEVSAYRTTYALGGVYSVLDATGTADAISGTVSYPLKRTREDSIYISGNLTHKALNDNVLGVSVANRRMDVGTATITRDMTGVFIGMPVVTNTAFSVSVGNVDFPDTAQQLANMAGVNTAGHFAKINLAFNGTIAFTDKLSLITSLKAQKTLKKNLDSSEQIGLTGYYGIKSFDEGLAGDSGYIVTPELKYALPDIAAYRHSLGLFTDVGAVWLADPSYTVLQRAYTQLNDVGLGYYSTYEYSPNRFLLLKAQVVKSYGQDYGAAAYNKKTKALVQVGTTF